MRPDCFRPGLVEPGLGLLSLKKMNEADLMKMLKEVDITGNDMIDFDEFLRLMNVE